VPGKATLPPINSFRLRLEGLGLSDLGALRELDADPLVREFIDGGRPILGDGYQERTLAWLRSLETLAPRFGFWAARWVSSNEFVGWFHLRPSPRFGHQIELGYRLKRAAWGQGLATEGSIALLDYGFGRLGLDSVIAQTLERNSRSRKVLEKLNMRLETEFIYPKDLLPFWDEIERRAVLYAIDRSTWLKMAPKMPS
jgi:RimJ/RimL family protein N-acetyltransferase